MKVEMMVDWTAESMVDQKVANLVDKMVEC